MIEVRELASEDAAWEHELLVAGWGATAVARKGELVDVLPLDGFVATDGGERAGLLTYSCRSGELEVVTIQSLRPGVGIGRALLGAARTRAEELGMRRLWLITTDNNVRAIDLYRRWGMALAAVHEDGVERSRTVKPSIPLTDGRGAPIRHELELELVLRER